MYPHTRITRSSDRIHLTLPSMKIRWVFVDPCQRTRKALELGPLLAPSLQYPEQRLSEEIRSCRGAGPSKMGSSGTGTPTTYAEAPVNLADEFKSDETAYDKEEYLVTPGKEYPTSPPAVGDNKFTPTPTKGILKNSSGYFPTSDPYSSTTDYSQQSTARGRHEGRDKALPPPPPPPGPVFPDWDLPADGSAYRSRDEEALQASYGSGATVKRKTSMLKKMRDRISK